MRCSRPTVNPSKIPKPHLPCQFCKFVSGVYVTEELAMWYCDTCEHVCLPDTIVTYEHCDLCKRIAVSRFSPKSMQRMPCPKCTLFNKFWNRGYICPLPQHCYNETVPSPSKEFLLKIVRPFLS